MAWPTLGTPSERKIETRPVNVRAGRMIFDRILYDARRAQALDFGETARALGAQTRALSGDIDDPCYEYLRRRWRIAPTPIAGITDFRSLALLQAMASDAGMRPVLRIRHCAHGASMVHEAFGAGAYGAQASAHLCRAGSRWSGAAARLVLSLAAGEPGDCGHTGGVGNLGERRCAVDLSANPQAFDSRALVTWVIA
jgi:hypothetical protein